MVTTRAARHVRVAAFTLVLASAAAAQGQTTAFTYQGQLSASGALTTGSFDVRVGLFDSVAGGAQIGANQTVQAVPVSDGLFTVQLDFGVSAFPGANRFVEIAVRPAGVGSFTTLAPRQQISSSPYAIRTVSAATADALSSACVGCVQDSQIQGVAGSKVSGTIPAASIPTGSGNYIQNRTTPQAGASFNVGGFGTVGGVLSAGVVGIGTGSPGPGILLEVDGPTKIAPGGSGGYMQFFAPNAETGLTFAGNTNRVDLRFDDATLKLVVGPTGGPPAATSGVAITPAGNVGIGTTTPTSGKLHAVGNANLPAIYGESPNRGVWGHCTGASRGVYGDSVSGEGVHGESVSGAGVAGVSHGSESAAVGGSNDTGGTGVFAQSFGGFNTGFAMVAVVLGREGFGERTARAIGGTSDTGRFCQFTRLCGLPARPNG